MANTNNQMADNLPVKHSEWAQEILESLKQNKIFEAKMSLICLVTALKFNESCDEFMAKLRVN